MPPNQSESLQPYELRPVEGDKVSYRFTTDFGCEYLINFIQSEGYDYGDIGDSIVYEYQILPVSEEAAHFDKRISHTVVDSIFRLLKDKKNVVFYICASSDNQQHLRHYKFHKWFERFKTEDAYKIDGQIPSADGGGKVEYISVILSKLNPYCKKVEQTFRKILYLDKG